MNLIRTILIDDERAARQRMQRLLQQEADVEIVLECADGESAVAEIKARQPDLIFLDINMPGKSGFDVLDALRPDEQPGAVIFVTAYDEHAVRAFESCALDYLLKPTSPERLAKAMIRARSQLATRVRKDIPDPVGEADAVAKASTRFTVRSGNRLSFVAPEEIDWVEAAGNYMILHAGRHNHMIRETMAGMERKLPGDQFLRVSRSALVNLAQVKELQTTAVGDQFVVLHDGQRVSTTRPIKEVAERIARRR